MDNYSVGDPNISGGNNMKVIKILLLIGAFFISTIIAQSITSINPNNAMQSQSLSVSITGQSTNFGQGTSTVNSVWFSKTGSNNIDASNVWPSNNTSLSASLTIPSDAVIGEWDVNVQNSTDGTITLSNGFTINDDVAPIAPVLSTPSNGSTTNDYTPTLDWNDPTLAYRYELIIDNNSDFSSPEIEQTNFSSSSYTISLNNALTNGLWYWKVRAKNIVNIWGDWSEVWNFTVTTVPTLTSTSPDNATQSQILSVSITGQNTHFGQSTSTVVSNVWFTKAGSSNIDASSFSPSNNTSLSANFTIPSDATTGTWDVNIQSSIDGSLSLNNGFTINASEPAPDAPTLSLPANGSTSNDNTPLFDWNDPTYAYRYHLIVDDNSDFSSPVVEQTDLSSSSYTYNNILHNGTYYWKVRAKNIINTWGQWSDTCSFILNSITSVDPDNALQGQSLSVTITAQGTTFGQGTTTISNVWFSKSSSTIVADNYSTLSPTSLTANFNIPNNAAAGIWDVNVSYGDTVFLNNGFTINATNPTPGTPQNLTASAGNQQIALNWNTIADADLAKYRIYRGTSSPATALIDSNLASSPPDTFYTNSGLTNGQIYYYRVTAVDSGGNESGYSNEVSATPIGALAWSMQLQASQSTYNDNDNYLGVAADATNIFDGNYDVVEPPASPGNSIRLFFPHPEWNNQLGNNFSKDIRPVVDLSDSLQIWNFKVVSTTSGTATIALLLTNASSVWPFDLVTDESLLTEGYNADSTSYIFTFSSITDSLHAFSIEIGDTTALTISSVTSSIANGYYSVGDTIPVQIIFDESVIVTGTPTLTLETGLVDAIVGYSSGSGSSTLSFNYIISAEETSADLNYTSTSALSLNGGTIKDSSGETAILTLPGLTSNNSLGGNKNLIIDTQVPSIAHAGEFDGPKIFIANSSHVMSWTMSADVSSLVIYFSPDSGQSYSTLNTLGTGTNSWQWQVPDSNMIYGGKLKFTATDSAGNKADDFSDYVFAIVGDSLSSAISTGWNLWGAPINPTNDTMTVNLSDDFTQYWVTYDYVNNGYTYDGILKETEGYWLGSLQDATIDVVGTPIVSNTTMNLSLGWDLISNPLVLDVTVDSLTFTRSSVTKTHAEAVSSGWVNSIYGYDGSGYTVTSSFEPWNGYWIGVLEDSVTMTFPIHKHTSGSRNQSREEDGWRIALEASSDNSQDQTTILGASANATDDFDYDFDEVKPPTSPNPDQVVLNIYHPEWDHPLGDNFAKDIRLDILQDNFKEWLLNIESSAPEVELSWTLSNDIPAEFEVGIDVDADGYFEDMRTLEEVSMAGNSEFVIRVGSSILGNGHEILIPKEFALRQNYPNPFNPVTTIHYELPQRSDSQITIFDLLGRKVITLVSETQDAGYKSIQWDATNANGQSVSGGMYFYQIKAGDYVQTRKMILLK